MTRGRYPLEVVRTVREQTEETRERELASAIEGRDRALRAHAAAAAALEEHRAREAARRARASGERRARGAALVRESAFADRQRDEEKRLRAAVDVAADAVTAATRALTGAQRALTEAAVEREVVERHHDRWTGAQREAQEKREEDERDDRR